jgi:hypothetical protein
LCLKNSIAEFALDNPFPAVILQTTLTQYKLKRHKKKGEKNPSNGSL